MKSSIQEHLRQSAWPHIWCPGCGNGIVLAAILRAIDRLNLDPADVAIVSGIGCSSRGSGFTNFNTANTLHGRALPVATGIKLSKPNMHVLVITGDGDATAIGGNHFIHAARRNIDITTIIFNNGIYGMTGGQYSPMTPTDSKASSAPYGNFEQPFDITKLAIAAGATYVARGTSFHAAQLTSHIALGISNKGFSVIEAVTQCPIAYGRRNKMGTAAEMMEWQRDSAVKANAAARMSEEEMKDKFIVGELHNKPREEYTFAYDKLVAHAQQRRS
ncbi:MAG: 2-oxoacid:ferredoxin oxidoreductase subunit beta [Betaproteobacteria bacterium]